MAVGWMTTYNTFRSAVEPIQPPTGIVGYKFGVKVFGGGR